MTDLRDAEPQPPDNSGGYCCVSAGMHMGHDEDCPIDTPLGPETLNALKVRMHDAIWGPYVEPIDRQNEQHEWLKLVWTHVRAWEAERAFVNEDVTSLHCQLAAALREKEADREAYRLLSMNLGGQITDLHKQVEALERAVAFYADLAPAPGE